MSAFDWAEAESSGEIAVPYQPRLAVYPTTSGHIAIREEGRFGSDEDQTVIVTPANLPDLLEHLKMAADLLAGEPLNCGFPSKEPSSTQAPTKQANLTLEGGSE